MALPDVGAITHEIAELYASDPGIFSNRTGCTPLSKIEFNLAYFGTGYAATMPDCTLDPQISEYERLLVLHYLHGAAQDNVATGSPESAQFVSFQSLPNGMFYYGPFRRRTVDRLIPIFGKDRDLFRRSADILGGTPYVDGDAAASFRVFPKIDVKIILNYGDDEFPPEMNMLFPDYIEPVPKPTISRWHQFGGGIDRTIVRRWAESTGTSLVFCR